MSRWATEKGEAANWFWDHFIDETDECIIWPYGTITGYPVLRMDKKNKFLGELVCEIRYGKKPGKEYESCHGPCHNRRCINYRHLSWGTKSQNGKDRFRDNTASIHYARLFSDNRGMKSHLAKLTNSEILEIRELYKTGKYRQQDIANMFGVSQTNISSIIRGFTWTHVENTEFKYTGRDLFS